MKYYKDRNNQVYAYEDDVAEFGSYVEVDREDENGVVTKEKVYHELTVKDSLTRITEDEALSIINPPASPELLILENTNRNSDIKQSLIVDAESVIKRLETAFKLGMQKKGDEVRLQEWQVYLVLLDQLDVTEEDMALPIKPQN